MGGLMDDFEDKFFEEFAIGDGSGVSDAFGTEVCLVEVTDATG